MEAFYKEQYEFQLFGFQHLTTLLVAIVFGVFIVWYGKKQSAQNQERIGIVMGTVLCITAIGWILIRAYFGYFDYQTDLPFDLCNSSAILFPFFVWKRRDWTFQILYYWIMAGTLQATLTPHLTHGFPHYTFLKYFIVHCGLVVAIWYVALVLKFRPSVQGIKWAFLATQVYFWGLLYPINLVLHSNYGYLMHKPDVASLLDYFGPHPWYLVVCEGLLLFFFGMWYLPFWKKEKN